MNAPGCPPGHAKHGPRYDHGLALRLDDAGRSHAEIADACGVTKAAISKLLCDHGRYRRPWQRRRSEG